MRLQFVLIANIGQPSDNPDLMIVNADEYIDWYKWDEEYQEIENQLGLYLPVFSIAFLILS